MSDLTAKLTVKVGTTGQDSLDRLLKQLEQLGGKSANTIVRTSEAATRQVDRQANLAARAADRQAAAQQRASERAAIAAERAAARESRAAEKEGAKIIRLAEREAATKQRLVDREATRVIRAAERQAAAEQKAAERAAAASVRAAERAAERRERIAEREAARVIRLAEKEAAAKARAEERAQRAGSFFTGHGMGNKLRQGLAVARDATVAAFGIRAAIGGAIGIGRAVMDPTADFQAQMVQMGLKGGFGQADIDSIRGMIMQSARGSSGFSPTQAGSAGIELAAAGVNASAMRSALPSTLRFAQSAGIGTGDAATTLADTAAQFGIAQDQFEHIGDVITRAANASTISVGDVAESMKYVAPIARSAGMSLEFTAGTLALLGSSGLKGSQGGTSLRTMITSLVHPSKRAKDALAELHLSAKDLQKGLTDLPSFMRLLQGRMAKSGFSDAKKLEIAELLFGVEGMTAATVLQRAATDNGAEGWKHYTQEMQNASGEMAKGADAAAKTLSGRMSALKASVEAAEIEIGEKFVPVLERLSPRLQAAANDVSSWANRNGEILPSLVEGAGYLGGAAIAAGAASWAASLTATVAGPAATAAMSAAGTTLAGTFLAALTAGIVGYKIGSVIADSIGAEEFGAKVHRFFNGDAAPQQEGRGMGDVVPTNTLTVRQMIERNRREREGAVPLALQRNDDYDATMLRNDSSFRAVGGNGFPFAGKLEISLTQDGRVKALDLQQSGPLKVELPRGQNVGAH